MAKHGFDITDFGSAERWKEFCQELDLKFQYHTKQVGNLDLNAFVWSTSGGLTVVTQNNPETGEYAPGAEFRANEKGFASYIGIEGPDYEVANCAARIRHYAESIKDESAGRRDFI